jgi:serine/threonine protein kinase
MDIHTKDIKIQADLQKTLPNPMIDPATPAALPANSMPPVDPCEIPEKRHPGSDRLKHYVVKDLIESGSTSSVFFGIDTRTRQNVAMKIISRSNYVGREYRESRERRIRREALLSFLLDHKHIVKLRDFFFTEENFYLVFDFVKGTQLLKHIIKQRRLKEGTARKYFRQTLSAVEYCHANSVVHRDLKIENILITSSDDAMLIDFGLSNFYNREGFLATFCGSLYFAAPELLSGKPYYGPEVDVWSLGVVLYVMVCGRVPFDDRNTQTLYQKIVRAKIDTPRASPELCDLLRRMLNPNPSMRISIEEVMRHPWVAVGGRLEPTSGAPARVGVPDEVILGYVKKLFGEQFPQPEIALCSPLWNPVKSIYSLLQRKKSLNPISSSDRIFSVMEFIEDRRLTVKRCFFGGWAGIKASDENMAKGIEHALRSLGVIYRVEAGKYHCALDNGLLFTLAIFKNTFSHRYGIRIKRSAGPGHLMKETKKKLLRGIKSTVLRGIP